MLKNLETDNYFTCTFNTTEDCNLRCKYCYEINKKPKTLKLEYAKGYVDHILSDPDPCDYFNNDKKNCNYFGGIVFDFIGGDSLINVSLMEQIMKYIIKKMYQADPTKNENIKYWKNKFKFATCTNGTLFNRPEIKDFCERYKNMMNLAISIDGCPEIHDLNRVYTNGNGTMADILKNWDWYQKTFPKDSKSTKATCNKDSIPYLYESLKFMHEKLGLTHIHQNFIMENMFLQPEDLKELDKQLELCTDYVLQHQHDLYWSMIDWTAAEAEKSKNWNTKGWCGSGGMPALSINGKIYPCFRWLPHTQCDNSFDNFSVGNYKDGFIHKENFAKVREGAIRSNCSKDPKCKDCNIESCCSYCIGGCYSEFKEFKRTTYSCEVNKLRVKWARKYWNEYNKQNGIDKRYDPEDIN